MEYKGGSFELKEINKGERSAVIAFATYNNIDRTNDILKKGAFAKSWNESKNDIRLFLNHDPNLAIGKNMDLWEDDNHAYTKAWMGTHTLGEDTLKMLDEGIISDSSFGFKTVKANNIEVKGQKVRELKELKHYEVSALTHWGANPMSKVQTVTKGLNIDIEELKASIARMEKFCRNTTASDETILNILSELKSAQELLSQYDTAFTPDEEPDASEENDEDDLTNEILSGIQIIHSKISI